MISKRYICTYANGPAMSFTKGKVYNINNRGCLIDDDNDVRRSPRHYKVNYKFELAYVKNLIGGRML